MTQILPGSDATRDPQSYAIIGAAMTVHSVLGRGFVEAVYREALELEFAVRFLQFSSEVVLRVGYRGQLLKAQFRADFVCCGRIIVEIKALSRLGPSEEQQIINYLKAGGFEIGLLLNFGSGSLEYRRFVRSR